MNCFLLVDLTSPNLGSGIQYIKSKVFSLEGKKVPGLKLVKVNRNPYIVLSYPLLWDSRSRLCNLALRPY